MSQRTDLITVCARQIVLVCSAFDPYATIWLMIEKLPGSPTLVQNNPPPKVSDFNKRRWALYNALRRTGGPSLRLPGCSWPIHNSGKTGPNTDSLKIRYLKNSLFRPEKLWVNFTKTPNRLPNFRLIFTNSCLIAIWRKSRNYCRKVRFASLRTTSEWRNFPRSI